MTSITITLRACEIEQTLEASAPDLGRAIIAFLDRLFSDLGEESAAICAADSEFWAKIAEAAEQFQNHGSAKVEYSDMSTPEDSLILTISESPH